jgi:hypothetical protein
MILFNALDREYQVAENLEGFRVHPVLANGTDTRYHDLNPGLEGVMLPPHSAVVLVLPQQGADQGPFRCNN